MSAVLLASEFAKGLKQRSRELPAGHRLLSDIVPNVTGSTRLCDIVSGIQRRVLTAVKPVFVAVVWHPEYFLDTTDTGTLQFEKRNYDFSKRRDDDKRGRASTLFRGIGGTEEENQEAYGHLHTATYGEAGHLHIYHSCPYYNSWCRCNLFKRVNFKRRRSTRRVLYCEDLTTLYWHNWLKYYCSTPRRVIFMAFHEIPGQVGSIRGFEGLQRLEEFESGGPPEALEVGCLSRQDCGGESPGNENDQASEESGSRTPSSDASSSARLPRPDFRPSSELSRKILAHKKLVGAIMNFVCAPILSTCEIKEWIDHPHLSYYGKGDPEYIRACNTVGKQMVNWNMPEFLQHYNREGIIKYWYARSPDHYMGPVASKLVCDRLLRWQFPDKDERNQFLQRLYDICERNIPKTNTIWIQGPPNSGKTFFIDMVLAFYINVGQVGNYVRSNNFPLDGCVNRRILLWNEPSIAPSCFDDVKMLTGGDACPANVKYQSGGSIIPKTPLMMTSNNTVFDMSDPVWSSRIYHYVWREAPFLQRYKGYLNPMEYYSQLYNAGIYKYRPAEPGEEYSEIDSLDLDEMLGGKYK